MPAGTAISTLREQTADALRPRVRVDADRWIESRVKMSDQFEASRGPYDLSARPWWREPLRVVGNPNTRAVRLKASPQTGKTLALSALMLYLAENSPASAMVVLPDRDSAIEFRDRLYALAEESGVQRPPKYRWNTRHCDIGDMRVYLAWPKSRQRLRGRRCKYVFRSEIDVYESIARVGDPIESSNQRVKGFPRHLIFDESSPVAEPSRIDALEADSDQRRWWGQCPHCRAWQEIRFFPHSSGEHAGRGGVVGLTDAEGQFLEPESAEKRAYYACVTPGCRITDADKPGFMLSGRWVPHGQSIDESGALVGKPLRDGRVAGFHLWAAHSNESWGAMAREYLRARSQGLLADVFQNLLGMSFKQRATMPTWRELGQRLAGGHGRGEVPREAWFLTAGGDVQEREVYVTVRAWGDQRTSWLVDWFNFQRSDGDEGELVKSDLAQITDQVLRRAWQIVGGAPNPRGQSTLRVVLLNIDANHRTLDVHNWIKSLGETRRVRAVRGDTNVKLSDKYKMSTVQHAKRDTSVVYSGGLELWGISPDVFRVDLAARFKSDPHRPGAWFVTRDAVDVGEWYLRQVVNEPQVLERGKDGRMKIVWKERDRSVGHDFWDCEVYCSAAAQMVVDGFPGAPGWDAGRWPKSRQESAERNMAESPVRREFD